MEANVHEGKLPEREVSEEVREIREAITVSESGAPAAGRTVRDIFTTDEIFQRIVATADEEFSVSVRLLSFSGLAAGLTMSLSFLGPVALAGGLYPQPAPLIDALLYPIGFIFIAIGRYQLFTENTLTPVSLVLARLASLPRLLRIWAIVFSANIVGTALAALFFAKTGVFGEGAEAAALRMARHVVSLSWIDVFCKGIVAGWLVAGMVWLNHAARSITARVLIVFVLMYTVDAADLAHCIVGSTEVLFLVFKGGAGLRAYLWGFLTPATAGNVLGGVLLVAMLNYARMQHKLFPDSVVLPWRTWFVGEKRA